MFTLQWAFAVVATLSIALQADNAWTRDRNQSQNAAKAVKLADNSAAASGVPYSTRQEAMQFAQDMAARRDLDSAWVQTTIGQARLLPTVSRLMQPPSKTFVKNWRTYRSRFIDTVRIEAGVKFWRTNEVSLLRAEQQYGVPPEIIVGIIGVETIYGRNTGSFRVIDALSTLAFDFPADHPRAQERSAYFKGELEQFLTLQSRRGTDPFEARGSYAGAMGMPQFMPTSVAKYAVDFDGDGIIDLWNSPADVIGSVASYFKAFNWQPGMATHYPVSFDASRLEMDTLMAPDILPTFSVESFLSKGAVPGGNGLQHVGSLALIELKNGADAAQYVAGTENFYAITRYNWSSYYAMAVIELGQEILARLKR